jgi:hypothetical protein
MTHPEMTGAPTGAYGYPYAPHYVAVGQPMAPVAPVGTAWPGAAQPPSPSAPAMGPMGLFLGAIAAAFLGGAGLAGSFAYQQPTAEMARAAQQQAELYQHRADEYERSLTEVRNQVCTTF